MGPRVLNLRHPQPPSDAGAVADGAPARATNVSRLIAPVGPIGIDFGASRANFVQFQHGEHPVVRAAVSVPYPDAAEPTLDSTENLKTLWASARAQQAFRGHTAVVSLPPHRVSMRFVPYKREAGHDDASSLVKALREQPGSQLENAVMDWLPIRPKSEEQDERAALVAIADKGQVVRLLDGLTAAGLAVDAIEVGPVAIKRLIAAVHDRERGNKVMCVNFGTARSYLTVLWDGEMLLDRDVEFGTELIADVVAQALEIDAHQASRFVQRYGIGAREDFAPDEDMGRAIENILEPAFNRLAEQIKKALVYTAAETRGGAIDQIYLLGSVACWRGVDRLLGELLALPIETLKPLFGFDSTPRSELPQNLDAIPGVAVSTGLALRGMPGHA